MYTGYAASTNAVSLQYTLHSIVFLIALRSTQADIYIVTRHYKNTGASLCLTTRGTMHHAVLLQCTVLQYGTML
jgi:hypothetical protein